MPLDTSWSFPPVVMLALSGYVAVYAARWRRSRAEGGARAAGYGHLALWILGIGILVVALMSPVDILGEQLASFHMIQHLLIADLAPIALTLALTKHILRPVTRRLQRLERAAGPFGHPIFGIVAYVGMMWLWHIPFMYDAALKHSGVHTIEHLTFGAAGLLYWWHLLSPIRSRMRMGGLGPVGYMAVTKVLVGLLGIVITFSPGTLFGYDFGGMPRLGLNELDDQHLAGVVMTFEQSVVMGIALAYLFARMLGESERDERRVERTTDAAEAAAKDVAERV